MAPVSRALCVSGEDLKIKRVLRGACLFGGLKKRWPRCKDRGSRDLENILGEVRHGG